MARRTAATSDVTPVAVSLWVASTALMRWPLSALRISPKRAAGMPSPQGVSTTSTSSPWRRHMSIQRWENMPFRAARTRSPGDSVLVSAVSQPPVPVEGKKKISAVSDRSTLRTLARAGCRISPNSGERWSMVGMSTALRIASGILVGPGMKTGFWKDMGASLGSGSVIG